MAVSPALPDACQEFFLMLSHLADEGLIAGFSVCGGPQYISVSVGPDRLPLAVNA
jgi:hypothetical protein